MKASWPILGIIPTDASENHENFKTVNSLHEIRTCIFPNTY